MPFIRLFTLERCTLFIASISFNREIISPYSYYAKKGLVYIIIISPFSCQLSFYSKYTKANTRLLCDVRLVPLNKYIFLYRYTRLYIHCSRLVPQCYGPSIISVTVTKGGHPSGSKLYRTSGTIRQRVSRVTQSTQYVHKVKTWKRHVLRTLNILTYQIPTYSAITMGRSYVFKHTVSTIKQFSSLQ